MATVIITITDCADQTVDVDCDFGEAGAQDDSIAHQVGVAAVQKALDLLKGEPQNG